MISTLVPDAVSCTEAFDDREPAPLHPQEAALVVRAVPSRRSEFATARQCARRALTRLGVPPGPLLQDHRGAPLWPQGVVGSITHCDGYRAAVVARAADVASLGIDAEPARPLPSGLLEAVARPEERAMVRSLIARRPQVRWERLLFSAKEAVYKATYPHLGLALEFTDAVVRFTEHGRFEARLVVGRDGTPEGDPVGAFHGRWYAGAGLVATAVTVPLSHDVRQDVRQDVRHEADPPTPQAAARPLLGPL
jgi:4'-phosphopantetheinyl transferase EntD